MGLVIRSSSCLLMLPVIIIINFVVYSQTQYIFVDLMFDFYIVNLKVFMMAPFPVVDY